MSWYSIFYWISVADGVKSFFDTLSNILIFFTIISIIMVVIAEFFRVDPDQKLDENDKKVAKAFRDKALSYFWKFFVFTAITWALYIFLPTKKDMLLIVAGGTTLNYLQKDSAAKQIPPEVLGLLRDKIKEWRFESQSDVLKAQGDTLVNKTKEELIDLIKSKK